MMGEEEALDIISDALKLESWFEGKTLTIMVEGQFVKLRLVSIKDSPSAADMRGEPA